MLYGQILTLERAIISYFHTVFCQKQAQKTLDFNTSSESLSLRFQINVIGPMELKLWPFKMKPAYRINCGHSNKQITLYG